MTEQNTARPISRTAQPISCAAGPISRAVGRELHKVRDNQGWSRRAVVEQMSEAVTTRALSSYELGYRALSLDRLFQICQVLGVSTADIVALAIQNEEIESPGLYIDLRAVIESGQPELLPLARWARGRLADDPRGPDVARLSEKMIDDLAMLLDVPRQELVEQLRTFTPELAPWRAP